MEINKVDTDDNLKRLIWKCKNLFLSLKILNTGEAKQQTLTEYAKIVNEVAKHYQENKLKLCQFYLDNQLSQHGLLWHSQVTPLLIELLLDRKPDDTTRCKLIDMTVHLVKQYGHDGILSDKLLLELFRAAIVHVIFLWQNDSNYSKSQEISDLTAQLLRECSKVITYISNELADDIKNSLEYLMSLIQRAWDENRVFVRDVYDIKVSYDYANKLLGLCYKTRHKRGFDTIKNVY